MSKYDNPMSRQVESLPELIKQQYEDLEPKTRTVLSFQEIFNIQRIVLTGCGDSYAAAMATKHAFEMLTAIPTEVVPAIELSRFYCEKHMGIDCRNPLVISVSNSGTGARVAEAVQRARKHGCYVLGVTGNMESPLAQNSDKVLKLEIPSFEDAPGTRSYLVSVMALLLLAVRFGEVRGKYTMDQAMDYRYDIENQGKLLEKLLPEMKMSCEKVAEEWKDFPCYDFVGAGFDYATAWFGQAKILEATGKFAMHINSEEWFHLNFFARDARHMGTVLVANTTNPAMSRNREMLKYANELHRPMVVITDGSEEDFGGEKAEYIKVPAPKYPISMPLTHFAPVCLIASYISVLIGEKYGRGCEDEWSFCKGGYCVKNSEIIVK
ncbi:SIS domain-containing protein [Ruminococcus sp. 5_1_39BFAA]|uniref:SIS domain-containing protein n=1 Tax=Ruminococcus sp. 5_1_39BFAA TaxID=457412 RepID=UPI003566500E